MVKHTIFFELPPTDNNLFVHNPRTRTRFPSKRYKDWRKYAPYLERKMLSGVKVELQHTFPDRRLRDAQNFQKSIIDYMVDSGFIADDNFYDVIEVKIKPMGINKEKSGVKVIVTEAQKERDKRWNKYFPDKTLEKLKNRK